MQKVRWAILGTSAFALDWIARSIKLGQNAELAAVVSRDPSKGAEAAERLGAEHTFRSIEEIDTNAVDGVFMVLPNTLHAEYAVAAARRGLHVIGEKPMANSVAECRQMIDAARASGVILGVGHCMEWTSPMVKTRELLGSGAIGDIVSASISASYTAQPVAERRRRNSLEQGGGAIFDMGVHAIDGITRLLGPVEQVAALMGSRLAGYGYEDSSTLLVEFASGVHGIVQAHFTCHQNRMEIQGTQGRIWSNAWWGREFAGDLHLQRGDEIVDFDLPEVNVYVPQIEHVSECVLSGTTPAISGERGLENIAVIEAAIAAARTKTMVAVRS